MTAKALEAFYAIEPEKFGLKDIAKVAMDEASRSYDTQYLLVVNDLREKPDQQQITRAFAFAKLAQLADIAAKDADGFWKALRRVQAGGRF